MLVADSWVDNMERPVTLFKAVLNKRQKHAVSLIDGAKERTRVARARERCTGQPDFVVCLRHDRVPRARSASRGHSTSPCACAGSRCALLMSADFGWSRAV